MRCPDHPEAELVRSRLPSSSDAVLLCKVCLREVAKATITDQDRIEIEVDEQKA